MAVKDNRNKLLQEVLLAGFKVDPRITADTRRIIRLPGSIHGKTGLLCHRISLETLETQIDLWIHDVPSFFANIDIPKLAKVKPKKVNQSSKKITKQVREELVDQTYMLEVSNHLPNTKDRSSLIFWTPYSWGIEAVCLERLENLVRAENLADSYIFSDSQRILFICPEAFTRAKVVKLLDKIGMEKLSKTCLLYTSPSPRD